jgi:hypothetical protein
MKRRAEQERDEAIAREQADARQEALLADLKARQAGAPVAEPPPAEPEPDPPESPASDELADADESHSEEPERA